MLKRLARLVLGTGIGLTGAFLWLALLTAAPVQGAAAPAPANAPIIVNSVADYPDAQPGDGECATIISGSICTLRAAIMEANARPGPDVIQLQANTTYQLNRAGADDTALNGDLDITDSVSLLGAGPASTVIDGNGALTGDRVFQITGTVVISGVTIEHGHAANVAGGIYNTGRLTLINIVVYSNTANGLNDWGGGMYNAGPLTMTHSSILSNTTGNHNAYGGGMYNQALALIEDSTFAGNATFGGSGSPGEGGGLFNIGYTTTVVNSTFSGNSAVAGGGIYKGGYPLILINSTLSGNNSTGSGGGLYVYGGVTSLFNVTISQNLANSDNVNGGQGGGVANGGAGSLTFLNTLIGGNNKITTLHPFPRLDSDDCAGTIISQGYSLVQTVNTDYCTALGLPLAADPLLGPLQDNGGPTFTHALLPGSPAIDAGNPGDCTDNTGAPLATDQRGDLRPTAGHGRCDIGAYEVPAPLFLPLVRR